MCLVYLHSSSSSSKELLCMLICFGSCRHLDFDIVLTINPLIVFWRGSLFIFCLNLVSCPYASSLADWWIFVRIEFWWSTWSDLLCCILVFGCTRVRSNVLRLFIHFVLFNIFFLTKKKIKKKQRQIIFRK